MKRHGANAMTVRSVSRAYGDQADVGAGAYLLHASRLDWNLQVVLEQYLQITKAMFRSLATELVCDPSGTRTTTIPAPACSLPCSPVTPSS